MKKKIKVSSSYKLNIIVQLFTQLIVFKGTFSSFLVLQLRNHHVDEGTHSSSFHRYWLHCRFVFYVLVLIIGISIYNSRFLASTYFIYIRLDIRKLVN